MILQKREGKIAVIGDGSWGTAIVKILSENNFRVRWWMRHKEDVRHIRKYGHNGKYLQSVKFIKTRVKPNINIKKVLKDVDMVILAVPSAFIKDVLSQVSKYDLEDKIVVSAIKGIVPDDNLLVTDMVHQDFQVPKNKIGIISGPCHAEEVAMERQSYLTIASEDSVTCKRIADALRNRYIKVAELDDILGIEFSAVMKNIVALACGITYSLSMGDNFQAVLVSNSIQEISRFLQAVGPNGGRDLNQSVYLGDLLVTAYSQFSRNRIFGAMIGRGYSPKSASVEMNMIAEGYYAVKSIHEMNKKYKVDMPICDAVYRMIYEKTSPAVEIQLLKDKLS